MNNGIETILQAVFPDEKSPAYEIRLKILYAVLFETLRPEDLEKVMTEAVECERMMAEDTKISVKAFLSPAPENVLQEFSALAFECAMHRYRSGENLLLAEYQSKIFSQICNNKDIISDNLKKKYAKIISETIMDFAYAGGSTDCTSLRMHAIMM